MLSIITPVYNGSKFIIKNIESIQKLTIDYEHIIVDGGSNDGTLEILSNYKHIKVIHQKDNYGMYGAIDMGFNVSIGNFLTWVNCDDEVIAPGYDLLYNEAKSSKSDLVYSNSILHHVEKYKYENMFAKHFARFFLKQGIMPFVQPSAIFSKNAYLKVGGLNFKNLKIIGDRDLFQKIAFDHSLLFKYVPVFSTIFLRYSDSLFFKNKDLIKKEYKYVIKTNLSLFNRVLFRLSYYIRRLIF